jgi:myo-inositol-1(or 4)-monophosphatase
VTPLLEIACEVVAEAAALVRDARPEAIRAKDLPTDLVTEWDLRVEDLVRERLAVRTPDIPVVGEERGGEGTRAWILDPIDGTVNFAHGLPLWSVALALCDGPRCDVGVIAAPALGWTFQSVRGGGAWWRSAPGVELAPLRVSAVATLGSAMLASGFPYDRATSPENNFRQWDHFQRVSGACRRLGAASLDLCFVARGWYDGYWERRLHAWDIAAGTLLVEEAGGRVTDTRGADLDVRCGEVVASNGAIHQDMLNELAKADAGAP